MDTRLVVTLSGAAALAVYALIEDLAVMVVSAVSIGVIVYLFRGTRMRDRLIAIAAAGLGGAIAAQIGLTFYYHTGTSAPEADSGGLFMSAILIGLGNAAVVVVLATLAGAWLKRIDRKSE